MPAETDTARTRKMSGGAISKADATRRRIIEASQEEFLEKGFSGASLRAIGKRAGVTTGALYGCFKDKDAIFESIVGDPIARFYSEFRAAQLAFQAMESERKIKELHAFSREALLRLVDYMYDNRNAFLLALLGASGSKYDSWLEPVIGLEEEGTRLFIENLRSNGFPVKDVDDILVHILCSEYFHGLMETIVHTPDRDIAKLHIELLHSYSSAGWANLLGLETLA